MMKSKFKWLIVVALVLAIGACAGKKAKKGKKEGKEGGGVEEKEERKKGENPELQERLNGALNKLNNGAADPNAAPAALADAAGAGVQNDGVGNLVARPEKGPAQLAFNDARFPRANDGLQSHRGMRGLASPGSAKPVHGEKGDNRI